MESNTAKDNAPVYLPFKTFQSAVQNLRTHGLPGELDRTTWDSRSGTEQTQIISAFKFLGLIDNGQRTQESLRKLVKAKENSDEEKHLLAELLRQRYAKLFTLDLTTVTPGQLETAIGEYGASGTTRDRALRFFVKAAEHTGIKLSSRLTKGLRSSARASGDEPETSDESETKQNGGRKGRRRKSNVPPITPVTGNAMKTIVLPAVGGSLTVSGTFNPFGLIGDERQLVFSIIDQMNEFEKKYPANAGAQE